MTWEEYGTAVLWVLILVNVTTAVVTFRIARQIRRLRVEMERRAAAMRRLNDLQEEKYRELQQREQTAKEPCPRVASGKTDRCAYS